MEDGGGGEVAVDWKRAHLVPIFRKGEKEDLENDVPVSVTSVH